MYLTLNNLTIYYEKYGNHKNTILILPGWGNTRETFTYMINNLKENYTVYIIDYPGLGKSPIPTKTLNIYDYASIIISFLKQLKIENPIIIAHSFGGRIATLLTGYYHINIEKMIYIDTAGIKLRKNLLIIIKEKIYKILKKASYLFPKLKREKLQKKLLNVFASADYKALPPSMHATFKNIIKENLNKYYLKINSEVLLIWGENDKDTPLKAGKVQKKLIKNSEIIILKKATHFSYLEYPYLINKIIYKFIK